MTTERKEMEQWRSKQLRTWEKQSRPPPRATSPSIEPEQEKPMVEPVKRRGRPKGSKNKTTARSRFTRKAPPTGIAAEIEEIIEAEGNRLMAEGNGRDEAAYEPDPLAGLSEDERADYHTLRAQDEALHQIKQVPAQSGPALTKLFVAAVENGYVIRPAYSDAYKGAADDRSWVVTSREELARMVSWLVAERGSKASPDMLGGAVHMPQPEAHYAPPIGLTADETVG